jgi:pyruvate,water dikinase
MSLVLSFRDAACRDIEMAGGKGANLAFLTEADLPVPPGFCVTTEAYSEFAAAAGLDHKVTDMLGRLAGDAQSVETLSAELRHFIEACAMPESVALAIAGAYSRLGSHTYVAVRSSGTAEDLAGASFAGLHDTYLDVRGDDAVLAAVKRCWASMWTARATSYRHTRGFDQTAARIAVVVQQMAEADVAGVMFTANPMTAATDEIVINATWGLGEALVSGIVTPDEHILDDATLQVKEQRLGTKELRVVRNPVPAAGTVTEPVPPDQRACFALSERQLQRLGELGQRVTSVYQGAPQDMEWAITNDQLYLLQARPITGIVPSWDEDLEFWQSEQDRPDTLWTRAWADEVWNGAISPLTYSYRGHMFTESAKTCARICGIEEGIQARVYKYRQGEAYFNTQVHELFVERTALPVFRPALLGYASPESKSKLLNTNFNLFSYVDLLMKMASNGYSPFEGFRIWEDYEANRVAEADGRSADELRRLSDGALIEEFEHFVHLKTKFSRELWTHFFIYARDGVGFLGLLVNTWCGEAGPALMADLFCGLPKRTQTAEENMRLWRLSEHIRASGKLKKAFEEAGREYLRVFEQMPEAQQFLSDYRAFTKSHAHRGHADRDLYFDRRGDDPTIDYENFRLLLSTTADPEEREMQVHARRNAAISEVEMRLRNQPFGAARVWLFRQLLDYDFRFFLLRDNQRFYFDRYTYAMKRIAIEMGQRLANRRVLAREGDVYFLGRKELYALLTGDASDPLTQAKIEGRRTHFEAMLGKQAEPPAYLRANRPVAFDTGEGSGGMRGSGTSRGVVTARARVVTDLRNIGQIVEGDILITQSTDPGWTPVFNVIRGIVLETGGMLAHGSCLAREYGLPAVQLAGATRIIPDGATITVNGDTGEVTLHPSETSEAMAKRQSA